MLSKIGFWLARGGATPRSAAPSAGGRLPGPSHGAPAGGGCRRVPGQAGGGACQAGGDSPR